MCSVMYLLCAFLQNDVQLKRMQIVARNIYEFHSDTCGYISRSIVLADDNIHW